MILLIDNYDSFSYNLVQLAGRFISDIKVVRNDAITVSGIRELQPSSLILSPGPGYPGNAGICMEAIRKLRGEIPILGVCLGHQAICQVYGADISPAKELMHGKQSRIFIDTKSRIFSGLPKEVEVARYHSLIAEESAIPACLKVTAQTEGGTVMAVEHREYPVYGVQFHPESILTPRGDKMMENFLQIKTEKGERAV